jgi:hypothetical protein
MNEVTQAAISEMNKAKSNNATNKAISLLQQIEQNNTAIKTYEGSIKLEQENLSKAGVIPKVSDYMGTEFTKPLNAAQEAIVKGVEVIVKQKADGLVLVAQSATNRIENHKNNIASYQKANEELRKRLLELSVEPATAATLGV